MATPPLPADILALTEDEALAEMNRLDGISRSASEQLRLENIERLLEAMISSPAELAAWKQDFEEQRQGTYVDVVDPTLDDYQGPVQEVDVQMDDHGFRQGLVLILPLMGLAWWKTRKKGKR